MPMAVKADGYGVCSMTAVNDFSTWFAARMREVVGKRGAGRERREPFAYLGSFGDDFFSDE